jgi:hypothetical protein
LRGNSSVLRAGFSGAPIAVSTTRRAFCAESPLLERVGTTYYDIGVNPAMRSLVVFVISQMQKGQMIETSKFYSVIYANFPDECQRLGFTNSAPVEAKWKNDIRFGLRDAKDKGLIKHVGTPKSGQWQKL